MNVKTLAFALSFTLALGVFAADYYVGGDNASDENAGTADAPFATITKAVVTVRTAGDVIHVRPGSYETVHDGNASDSNAQRGPNLCVKLIGEGESRDDVVITGVNHRTLRMAAGSWVENMTIVGESTQKAEKGGAIEISGGTLKNCVIRDGSVKNGSANIEGGNLYINSDSALVENCVIFGGKATKRGGNIYLDRGTVRDCTIYGGTCENVGGNVLQYNGNMENCTIYGGNSVNDGGNVRMLGSGGIYDSYIYDGTVTAKDKKGANVYMDSSAKLTRCHLKGGANPNYNSGSLCINSASAVAEDCLIEGSQVGGVLMPTSGNDQLYNVTIVNNQKYGVWAWGENHKLVNCVIFENYNGTDRNEWAGNLPTHSSAVFLNNATSEGGRFSKATFPTLVFATKDDFVDFDNADYRPREGGAIVDAGASDPRGATASTTDLDGNPRASGSVDVGCYEYQKQDMTVRLESGEYSQIWAPTTVTFTHVVEHSASPENVVVTYDFGDGSVAESTKENTIQHAYAAAGIYTVKIKATNECVEEAAEMTYEGYVRVASTTIYVNAGNAKPEFPYDTLEKGYAKLKDAVIAAYDGYTLLLGEGVYGDADQLSITKALTIKGLGATPEAVIIRNTADAPNATYSRRTLEFKNAAGWLENVTVDNGKVINQFGGCLRLADGATATNCVIRGGLARVDGKGNAAGGGVAVAGQKTTLTHCKIINNRVEGTSGYHGYVGGAVFVENSAKNCHLSNLLVSDNVYAPSDALHGTAGVRYGGDNDWVTMENCTVVNNKVEGALPEDSAALYCTSWHVIFRNNLFAGNSETEKDESGKITSVTLDTNGGSQYQYYNNLTDDVVINGSGNKTGGNICVSDLRMVFKDFANGDYHLVPNSPACNRGVARLDVNPSVDLDGNDRVFGKAIDIGCYECQRLAGLAIIIE